VSVRLPPTSGRVAQIVGAFEGVASCPQRAVEFGHSGSVNPPGCAWLAAASAFGRRLVLRCQGRFPGGQTPKLLGIAHDRADVACAVYGFPASLLAYSDLRNSAFGLPPLSMGSNLGT